MEKKPLDKYQVSATYVGLRGYRLPYSRLPLRCQQMMSDSTIAMFRQEWIARNGYSDPRADQEASPHQSVTGPLSAFRAPWNGRTVNRSETLIPYQLMGGYAKVAPIGWNNLNSLVLAVTERRLPRIRRGYGHRSLRSLDRRRALVHE